MPGLYLLSNAWGPKAGGINAFNTDFAKALGLALAGQVPVACIVLEADDADRLDADRSQVRLVAIGKSPTHGDIDPSRAHDIADALRAQGLAVDGACWVGNDIISADAALRMRDVVEDATVVLIHHMSYIDYQGIKHGVAQAADDKHKRQRALFGQADRTFGVGPLLRDRLQDLLPADAAAAGLIIPGLPDVQPRPAPSVFTACSFGRLDPENDRIKQGRLAVAGFAALVARADQRGMPRSLKRRPQLRLIGIGAPGGDEERGLRAFAEQRAGRAVNLLALPYDDNRDEVLNGLARSSAALMLSWHEGFGLTGWEAIGAEVPLILGTNSGLYELIDHRLGRAGTGCVDGIDIQGRSGAAGNETEPGDDPVHFTDEDASRVCHALLDIASDPDRARADAKRLRQMLVDEGCTWQAAARRFAEDLGLPLPPPPDPQLRPRSASEGTTASVDSPAPDHGHRKAGDVHPEEPKPPDACAAAASLAIPQRHPNPQQAAALLSESRLLRADTECVPFHAAREPVLQELLGWATDPNGHHAAVQLRVGAGGLGKTRLLRELCHRLHDACWHAGFLRAGSVLHGSELTELLRRHGRVLVVVDYAETRRETLIPLLRSAMQTDPAQRLRIMLLARSAGDWWDRLKEDHGPELEDFLTGPAVRGPFAVPPIADDLAGRGQLYHEARAAFVQALDPSPSAAAAQTPPPDLSAAHFAEVLQIHLAALAGLNGERPETATALLDAQLRREARYWRQAAADRQIGDHADLAIAQPLALITLADGAPGMQRVRALVAQAPALAAMPPAERDALLALLRAFYPLQGGIDALRPDLLGERLVARALARDDSLLDLSLGPASDTTLRRSALTLLTRLARHDPAAEVWLRMGLARYPSHCADDLLAVAVEVGDPAGRVFAEVLDEVPAKERIGLCDRLSPRLPDSTVVLSELAEVVVRHRLEAARRKAGKRLRNKDRLRLHDRYKMHGLRQRSLGRLEESRAAHEEALALARHLARSSNPAALFFVAGDLSNLVGTCHDLGAVEEAKRYGNESLQIQRRLPEGRFSPPVMEAQRAGVLHNYGGLLSSMGKFDEALAHDQEALSIGRRLAYAQPAEYKFDLALSLESVGIDLSYLDRHEDALAHVAEALSIYRELVQARPDAYVRDLARALNNLSNRLRDLGQHDAALTHAKEALLIRRQLAQARPDAYEADLAGSLDNVANSLSDLGRYDDALTHAEEALSILRRLAQARPDVYKAHLAGSLNNVGSCLNDLGRYDDALTHAEEALSIRRRLAQARPDAHESGLARSLNNVGSCLSDLGRYDDALTHTEEALSIYRRLAQARPDAHAADLARSLANLAVTKLLIRQPQAAVSRARQAIELLDARPNALACAIQRERGWALGLHAWALLETDDSEAAAKQSATAITRWQRLLAETPAVFPQGAALGGWIAWRCARAIGDDAAAATAATLALEVVERWVGNGAEALPAYLIDPVRALLETAAPDRFPQARGLLAQPGS